MMHSFKEKWDLLFTQMLRSTNTLGYNAVSITETDKIYLNKTKFVSRRCSIIGDILIICINLDSIPIYL